MTTSRSPYYRPDLAYVHHSGFAFHANACAPGILALLQPVLDRGGTVLEIGCGSGLLTRYLVEAGHRVIATDASPAMLDLAREAAPDAAEVRMLTLPDDPVPEVDAIVGVGHALNYLPDEPAVAQALEKLCAALRPRGVLAVDICDLEYGELRRDAGDLARVEDDWAMFARFSLPRPNLFVRTLTTFVRADDGTWRRDDEQHDNVLLDTRPLPELLGRHGVDTVLDTAFGTESNPQGLKTLVGQKRDEG